MAQRDVMMVTELGHPRRAWLDRNSCGRTETSYSSQKNGKSHWVARFISGVFERGSQLCERVWRLTWIGLVPAESLLESQDDSRLRYFWVGCWQLSPCFWTDHITSSWPICSWLSKSCFASLWGLSLRLNPESTRAVSPRKGVSWGLKWFFIKQTKITWTDGNGWFKHVK